MNATIVIIDAETDEVLETLGKISYDNAGIAIKNCTTWYAEEIESWESRNYVVEIVLRDDKEISSAAATLGKLGGSKTSEAKARAARENGKLGGRPRK